MSATETVPKSVATYRKLARSLRRCSMAPHTPRPVKSMVKGRRLPANTVAVPARPRVHCQSKYWR